MKKPVKTFKFSKPINLYCFTDVHIGAKEFDKVTLSGFTVGLPSFYPEGKTFILENPNRALIFDTVTVVGERGEQIKMDLACLYSLMVEYKVDKPDNVS